MATRKGFMMYFEVAQVLNKLSPEQVKRLVLDMCAYAEKGRGPDYSDEPILEVLWVMCRARLDADAERYAQTVHKRREAANKRWDQARAQEAAAEGPKEQRDPPVYRSKYRPAPAAVSTAEEMNKYLNF